MCVVECFTYVKRPEGMHLALNCILL